MSDIGHHDTSADEKLIPTLKKDIGDTLTCKC